MFESEVVKYFFIAEFQDQLIASLAFNKYLYWAAKAITWPKTPGDQDKYRHFPEFLFW